MRLLAPSPTSQARLAKERPAKGAAAAVGSTTGGGEGAWSVSEVLEVIKANARGWRGDGLKLFAELRFTCAICSRHTTPHYPPAPSLPDVYSRDRKSVV